MHDHIVRVTDLAESYRDLISGSLEAYLSVVSNRMNEIMKVLTIFSAIMLPLTFIAGVYGMNFDNMPELHSRFGYYTVWGIMIVVAVGMLFLFWTGRLDWSWATPGKKPRVNERVIAYVISICEIVELLYPFPRSFTSGRHRLFRRGSSLRPIRR